MWTCNRQVDKIKCRHKNRNRVRNCGKCGKPKPKKRRPAHMVALDLPYEAYVTLQGGEFCGICGRGRSEVRRLDRDHDHKTGRPRGLLCWRCNSQLKGWMTREWLLAASEYLERADQHVFDQSEFG